MIDLITEEFTLPSQGKIYSTPFDPTVKLRSMTVADEMKRLSPSKHPYKTMADIIEDCLITKLPIKVYNLCLGDYIYLLNKLRTVTYGSEYKVQFICSHCGEVVDGIVNLDELKVKTFDKSFSDKLEIELPMTKKEVVLKPQTPKDLDWISNTADKDMKAFPEMANPEMIYKIMSMIDTFDGEPLDILMGKELIKKLPMRDINYLLQKGDIINSLIGIDNNINVECKKCGENTLVGFKYTSEFFRPTVD